MNFREKWQLRIVVLRAPHGGTSGSLSLPAWWYFGTPHPPARHGDSADLRRKRTIGISKPHGGISRPPHYRDGGTSGYVVVVLQGPYSGTSRSLKVVLRGPMEPVLVVLRGP